MRAPQGFSSNWLVVGGLRLHALESAGPDGGPTAVLLPGLVTASRSMVPLARELMRRNVRVRILDPPGFGYSDKPRRALRTCDQASIIAEWLTASAGGVARIVGNSFGCQVAATVAACRPEVAERLVLLSPTLDPQLRRWLKWLEKLQRAPGHGMTPTGQWRVRLLGRLHGSLGDEPSLRALNVAEYPCGGIPRALGTLRYAVVDSIEDVLPAVRVPTLLVRADQDRLSTLGWAERLAAMTPDGHLRRLARSGHGAFVQEPAAVAAIISAFLASPNLGSRGSGGATFGDQSAGNSAS